MFSLSDKYLFALDSRFFCFTHSPQSEGENFPVANKEQETLLNGPRVRFSPKPLPGNGLQLVSVRVSKTDFGEPALQPADASSNEF